MGWSALLSEPGPRRGPAFANWAGLAKWKVGFASLAAMALLWEASAWGVGQPRWAPPLSAVLLRLAEEMVSGDLFHHLGATLGRVAAAFAIAMTIGIAIGVAMGRRAVIDRWGEPWLLFFLNLPALVLIVLSYVWIGLNETAAIFAVSLNKIPNVATQLREGARALDPKLLEMAQVYRYGRWRTLRHVVLPQLYPHIAAAARTGLALIWKIVLVVELLGRSNGVGFQIGVFFQLFDVTSILAYALAFILIVQAIEWGVLQPLEARATRWRR